MEMTPELYTEKRNDLLRILEDAASYEELDMKTRLTFDRTIGRLQTNSFEIVLVGEFQGGKSTTFNAICDGRDISPMGSGIKTSACKISAHNILDSNEEERAVIQWKTDSELILTMLDILCRNSTNEQANRFSKRDNEGNFTEISLDNPDDVQLMRECVEKEWETYKRRPAAYDPNQEGKLDLLYIASLILHYFSDSFIHEIRKESRVMSIAEMRPYVVFPTDWTTRWEQRRPDAFNVKEVVLVFVTKVDCYIHSPNLQRLGCVITDCPGLFAGPWDTTVARDAMLNADAILYLLRGDKQIGEQELRALREIQKTNQLHKLFFAMNARASYQHLRDKIRPANASTINNNLGGQEDSDGLHVEIEDIYIFNALLAFNAKHYPILAQSGDKDKIIEWEDKTEPALTTFCALSSRRDADRITHLLQSPIELSRESRYDELLTTIEMMVVSKKAESLLYSNGVVPVNVALEKLESELKLRESKALEDCNKTEAEAKKAKNALEDFQKKSREIVNAELDDPSISEILQDDYVNEIYVSNTTMIAHSLSDKVDYMMGSDSPQVMFIWGLIKQKISGYDNEQVKLFSELLSGYVSHSIEEVCTPAKKGWLTNIAAGKNKRYNNYIGKGVRNISDKVKMLWERTLDTETDIREYLEGLAPQCITAPSHIGDKILHSFNGSELCSLVQTTMVKQFALGIGTVIVAALVSGVSALLASFILLTIFTGLGGVVELLIVFGSVIAAIATGGKISEVIYKHFGDKILCALNQGLESKLCDSFKDSKIRSGLDREAGMFIQSLIDVNKQYFWDEFEEQSKDFNIRCEKTLADKRKSDNERKLIAAHAKTVYTQIAEYRKPIAEFTTNVKPYFE